MAVAGNYAFITGKPMAFQGNHTGKDIYIYIHKCMLSSKDGFVVIGISTLASKQAAQRIFEHSSGSRNRQS